MAEFKDCFSEKDKIKIGEKTYTVGKITIGDIIKFQNWCDKEQKKELVELYKMTGEKIDIEKLKKLSCEPELYNQKMNSSEGVLFLFISILERLNKDVNAEEIKNNVTLNDLNKIAEIINESISEGDKEQENFQEVKQETKLD